MTDYYAKAMLKNARYRQWVGKCFIAALLADLTIAQAWEYTKEAFHAGELLESVDEIAMDMQLYFSDEQ